MAVVLIMSGPQMSAENTGGILGPVLGWLGLGPATIGIVHGLVRKSAHVTEYAVLGLLWRRAFIHAGVLRPAVAAALALVVSVGCAVADETHQSFLAARTGAVSDVVLDSLAAMAAIAGLELLTRGVRLYQPVGYVLALFGQTSLVLYTAHMFVLPVLELADHLGRLSGAVRVAVAFVPFAVFCGLVMYGQHRYLQRRAQEPGGAAAA